MGNSACHSRDLWLSHHGLAYSTLFRTCLTPLISEPSPNVASCSDGVLNKCLFNETIHDSELHSDLAIPRTSVLGPASKAEGDWVFIPSKRSLREGEEEADFSWGWPMGQSRQAGET